MKKNLIIFLVILILSCTPAVQHSESLAEPVNPEKTAIQKIKDKINELLQKMESSPANMNTEVVVLPAPVKGETSFPALEKTVIIELRKALYGTYNKYDLSRQNYFEYCNHRSFTFQSICKDEKQMQKDLRIFEVSIEESYAGINIRIMPKYIDGRTGDYVDENSNISKLTTTIELTKQEADQITKYSYDSADEKNFYISLIPEGLMENPYTSEDRLADALANELKCIYGVQAKPLDVVLKVKVHPALNIRLSERLQGSIQENIKCHVSQKDFPEVLDQINFYERCDVFRIEMPKFDTADALLLVKMFPAKSSDRIKIYVQSILLKENACLHYTANAYLKIDKNDILPIRVGVIFQEIIDGKPKRTQNCKIAEAEVGKWLLNYGINVDSHAGENIFNDYFLGKFDSALKTMSDLKIEGLITGTVRVSTRNEEGKINAHALLTGVEAFEPLKRSAVSIVPQQEGRSFDDDSSSEITKDVVKSKAVVNACYNLFKIPNFGYNIKKTYEDQRELAAQKWDHGFCQ